MVTSVGEVLRTLKCHGLNKRCSETFQWRNPGSRSFKRKKIFGVESKSIRNTRDGHGKVREEKATIF